MSLPERDTLLAEVRSLTEAYKAGGPPAADAFRELTHLLLRLTVLAPEGGVRLFSGPRGRPEFVLGGWRGHHYLRNPPDPHPSAHVQLRGNLVEDCLPDDTSLERVHFPTARVSLEADIRLLADQFGTPCHTEPALWRPVLAETERAFLEITHRPLGGPER